MKQLLAVVVLAPWLLGAACVQTYFRPVVRLDYGEVLVIWGRLNRIYGALELAIREGCKPGGAMAAEACKVAAEGHKEAARVAALLEARFRDPGREIDPETFTKALELVGRFAPLLGAL